MEDAILSNHQAIVEDLSLTFGTTDEKKLAVAIEKFLRTKKLPPKMCPVTAWSAVRDYQCSLELANVVKKHSCTDGQLASEFDKWEKN